MFHFRISQSYVTRIEENALTGSTLVFPEPYITRVMDDDAGKNGVFSLTLLGNNGTFEILPNVAERKANFIIKVRDNALLDYEQHTALSFQVIDGDILKMGFIKQYLLIYRFWHKNLALLQTYQLLLI